MDSPGTKLGKVDKEITEQRRGQPWTGETWRRAAETPKETGPGERLCLLRIERETEQVQ